MQEAVARLLTIAKVPGHENLADLGTKHLSQREMHECMRREGCHMCGRTIKVGVEGRKGVRLEPATLRDYENDRSTTSREILDRLRTSRRFQLHRDENGETRQPEFRVHLVERAWIQKDVGMHAAQVVRRCLTN